MNTHESHHHRRHVESKQTDSCEFMVSDMGSRRMGPPRVTYVRACSRDCKYNYAITHYGRIDTGHLWNLYQSNEI